MASSLILHCTMLVVIIFGTSSADITLNSGGRATDDIILHPLNSGGREAAVILISAPQMLPAQYLSLAKAVQATSSQRLWVSIVGLGGTAQPTQKDIAVMVDRATQGMEAQGFKKLKRIHK